MENFSQSSQALQRVAADVASSGRAIEHLKEQKAGAARPQARVQSEPQSAYAGLDCARHGARE